MTKDQHDLTEQEQKFISLLFEVDEKGICRHPEEAKLLAGYDKSTSIFKIIGKVKKKIIEHGDDFLAMFSPVGIQGLLAVLNDPTQPGAKIRLQAATELLDRAGVVKKEKTEAATESPNFVFIVPPKQPIIED